MTRTLIFGTSYVSTPERRDLTILWAKLVAKLNLGADMMLVDSASPFNPEVFLADMGWREDAQLLPDGRTEPYIWRWNNNIGHLGGGGKDGWGRSFCEGIEYGIRNNYDRIAYIDADILFAKPVDEIFDKMDRSGVKVAMPWEGQYGFPENGIVFMDAKFMDDIKFTAQYDWQNAKSFPLPEIRCEQILADHLFTLPLRGLRNDFDTITAENIARAFPWGPPAWITHCRDPQVYQAFLHINGLEV